MRFWPLAAVLTVAGLWTSGAQAEPVLREGFEGPEASLRDAGGDGTYKLSNQQRVPTGAHRGNGCERVDVTGGNGSYVYVAQDIGEARLIAELAANVWVKSDRPGMQILVRVVLPRSKDPRTGRPLTTLLRGSGYTQAGTWQQLTIDNLPQQLERQLRVLRAQNGPQVDGHEAVIDRVLINVYGGPGTTSVLVDDLEVTGFVGRLPGSSATAASPADGGAQRLPATSVGAAIESLPPGASARISGAGLVVGDKPFFPRVIEYRGESLSLLKSIGFNGVRMTSTPTPTMLREAAANGMWLIAPPPASRELEGRAAAGSTGKLGAEWDSVLVWDLGQELSTRELEATKRWSKLVRAVDPRNRPLICDADSDLRAYSRRHVDLLWTHRFPLGTSLSVGDYATWLRERPQLAVPGTPLWTVLQTQPSPQLLEQIKLLAGHASENFAWQDEQIRLLAFAALSSGVRGVGFQSLSPLDAADATTRRRAALLELLNLELDLIEPWCASGSFVTAAGGSDPEMAAAVMQTDRARLVLPLGTAPHGQFAVRGPATGGVTSYLVPGVPESNDAYELTPAGLRPLAHKRVAGGIRVFLAEGERGSLVLLTQDSAVVANLSRRAAKAKKRGAELIRQLATMHLARIDDLEPRLAARQLSTPQSHTWHEAARATLKQADAQFAAGDAQSAYTTARRGEQLLYQIERSCWEKTVTPVGAPLSTALGVSFGTLPEYWQFRAETSLLRSGPNLLRAGQFEDLREMLAAGWRNFQHAQTGIATDVKLGGETTHGGRFALKLQVTPAKADQPAALVETAPVWVSSAPVPLDAGELVVIHGWVNIPKAPTGSVDGLLILDSLGGDALAERILQTSGWREFTLYRASPSSGNLVVTFALTGFGEAWLDDVTISTVDRSSVALQSSARKLQ